MLMSLPLQKGRSLDRLARLIYQIDLSIANSTESIDGQGIMRSISDITSALAQQAHAS
ncbi:hypothetical protein J6524_23395 [Bradyrhizobium sp. WSM 1738]|uniref:hypothetical protein n=1 Tax=Bradyrhizobium hereditatis TaxID=2821405 RepID=UPI001CE2383F|nr:hypothetical protein [Bradyrhizobium hereditatis]MCA6117797.1 hypothetical protein [Bradyrhizobium hereditatis]